MIKRINITQQKYKSDFRKVRALMMLKGIQSTDIAERAKVSKIYVSYVIHGIRLGNRVRHVIADALGMTVEDLWPENGHKNKAA